MFKCISGKSRIIIAFDLRRLTVVVEHFYVRSVWKSEKRGWVVFKA